MTNYASNIDVKYVIFFHEPIWWGSLSKGERKYDGVICRDVKNDTTLLDLTCPALSHLV